MSDTNELNIKILSIARHRNGITGNPFDVVLFTATPDKSKELRMVATLFEERGSCAVLAVDPLSRDDGIRFGFNSYRGDHFEAYLREAIKKHDAKMFPKPSRVRFKVGDEIKIKASGKVHKWWNNATGLIHHLHDDKTATIICSEAPRHPNFCYYEGNCKIRVPISNLSNVRKKTKVSTLRREDNDDS